MDPTQHGRYVQTTEGLEITNAQYLDSRMFTCTASNIFGSREKHVYLVVIGKTEFSDYQISHPSPPFPLYQITHAVTIEFKTLLLTPPPELQSYDAEIHLPREEIIGQLQNSL